MDSRDRRLYMSDSLPPLPRWFALLGAVLVLAGSTIRGKTVEDFNTWFQYSLTGPLGSSRDGTNPWRYTFDSPNRFGGNSRHYSQGVWRGGIGYALTRQWSFWVGYGYSDTDVPYTRTPFGEHRPFQQVIWTGQGARFSLSSRHRLEERFPETGDDMGLRSRHQFRVSHPVAGIAPLSVVASEEIFFNLNATDYGAQRGVDQNRAFVGLGWRWSEILRTETGYMNHYIRRPGRENRMNHVWMINVSLAFR